MKTTPTITAVLALTVASLAQAQCELSTSIDSRVLSPEKLAIRGAIYQELCKRGGGNLVDGEDLQLKDRMVYIRPEIIRRVYPPDDLYRLMQKTKTILAYIVEPTGKVSWAAVLEPSGYKAVDATAFDIVRNAKPGVATLDGQPVRLFSTVQIGPFP
jgi:TonB family protein